jgi:hypothetical protein
MLWIAGRYPHDTSFPARAWASLLDLDEPLTNGARRVTAAVTWLVDNDLARADRHRGLPPTVFLLDERATKQAYLHPGAVISESKQSGRDIGFDDYYVNLPPELWAAGWISLLGAPGEPVGRRGRCTGSPA